MNSHDFDLLARFNLFLMLSKEYEQKALTKLLKVKKIILVKYNGTFNVVQQVKFLSDLLLDLYDFKDYVSCIFVRYYDDFVTDMINLLKATLNSEDYKELIQDWLSICSNINYHAKHAHNIIDLQERIINLTVLNEVEKFVDDFSEDILSTKEYHDDFYFDIEFINLDFLCAYSYKDKYGNEFTFDYPMIGYIKYLMYQRVNSVLVDKNYGTLLDSSGNDEESSREDNTKEVEEAYNEKEEFFMFANASYDSRIKCFLNVDKKCLCCYLSTKDNYNANEKYEIYKLLDIFKLPGKFRKFRIIRRIFIAASFLR